MSFKDKVILITGANSGIGAASAQYFARGGALLSLCARNAEKFEKVIEKIKEENPYCDPLVIIGDVTVDCERIISETIEKYNRLDILLNNAGFLIPSSFETLKLEDMDAIFATNAKAVFYMSQLAIPHLTKTKGNIVNVSSVAGIKYLSNSIAYCMAKAAVNQFTNNLAIELAPKGIRVNVVCPAFIDTDFCINAGVNPEYYDAVKDAYTAQHPIGRNGTVQDVVNAISYFANDENSFVTGTLLKVDGGLCVKSPL